MFAVSHRGISLPTERNTKLLLRHLMEQKTSLPLHETHAVEENAVKNKKAHVGVLKGCFLQEAGERNVMLVATNGNLLTIKNTNGFSSPHLVDAQGPKGQRFTGFCVYEQDFSVQDYTVTSWKSLRDEVFEMSHLEKQN